ncbi:hypothetical protein SAMN04487765_2822 [Tenacibaculum sp. MAR_2010_89]|uniref:hypothetical protein n=1 Tax=Tenacibaculum sp. MAR_2010_89 TaxID=1250198 RepID=UPI0008982FCC|nr:hypothetical protein [Tenacibaculum sp. MAR_2010_89]SEE49670.1 hypothetical protein SAMN04487765_2822 [Tenacibaculum sp. MAR_2010_89]
MDVKICEAISQKKIITFYYENELRKVEPHCYGLTTAGNKGLRAYQVDGYSKSGKYGWKMYDLNKSEQIKIVLENFNLRNDYKKGDKGMTLIYCEA